MPTWLSRLIVLSCVLAGLVLFAADEAVTGSIILLVALLVAGLATAVRSLLGPDHRAGPS